MDLKQLFVYGTLRRDLSSPTLLSPHHERFGEPLGLGRIPGIMYNIDDMYPGVIPLTNDFEEAPQVRGQVLSYDGLGEVEWGLELYHLDSYEGVREGLYTRNIVEVQMDDGESLDAFVYYFAMTDYLNENSIIQTGDWADA